VKRNTRWIGLLVFVLAVGAIQVLENLYRWYSFREERVHLTELREELVEEGAEMIRAQLEAEQVRMLISATDSMLDSRRREVEANRYRGWSGRYSRVHYTSYVKDVDTFNQAIRQRNVRLQELNAIVHRRNAAATRYYLLADSIRALAVRAGEPYFSVPIPAQAAAERGITRGHRSVAVGAWDAGGGNPLREDE
jgi:hypothetical protein